MVDLNSRIFLPCDKKATTEMTPGKCTPSNTSMHIPSGTRSGEIHPASDNGDKDGKRINAGMNSKSISPRNHKYLRSFHHTCIL